MTKRVWELDLARVCAMLAVILIHATSAYIGAESRFTLFGANAAFWGNQLARFAVPLFILLSGISLRLSDRGESAARFYRKRLTKIGLPYIAWSLVYELAENGFSPAALFTAERLPALGNALLLGRAASHLYFIVVLLQLYLLYPALRRWAETVPKALFTASLIVTLAAQCAIVFAERGIELLPASLRAVLWILFPTWLFYFVLGMLLVPRLDALRRVCVDSKCCIFALLAAAEFFYVPDARLSGSLGAAKPALLPITVLALACAFAAWDSVGKSRIVRGITAFLSRHSMTIYFGHVLVLRLLGSAAYRMGGMAAPAFLFAAVLLLSALAAWIIDGAAAAVRGRIALRHSAPTQRKEEDP